MSLSRVALALYTMLLLHLGHSPLSAQDAPLAWKFSTGDEHHYRLTQQVTSAINLGAAGENQSEVKQVLDLEWQVEEVDGAGTAQMTQTISRVQIEILSPGQMELKFDSSAEEDPSGFAAMLAPGIKALTEAPLKLTMTKRGTIPAIEIPDRLIGAIENLPAADMLADMATKEGIRRMLEQAALVLPESIKLAPGTEWVNNRAFDDTLAGRMSFETTYRYVGPREVEGKRLEVFEPRIEMEWQPAAKVDAAEVTAQSTSGEVMFDPVAGRLESSVFDQRYELEMTVAGKPVQQRINQIVELVRVSAADD